MPTITTIPGATDNKFLDAHRWYHDGTHTYSTFYPPGYWFTTFVVVGFNYYRMWDHAYYHFRNIFRYAISGISQSTSITSAVLRIWLNDAFGAGGNVGFKFKGRDEADPDMVTPYEVMSNKTQILASGTAIPETIGEVITATKNVVHGGNYDSKAAYDYYDFDITDLIQELVDAYDYTDAHMILFDQHISGNQVHRYGRQWGTDKAPELVIEYGGGWTHKINSIAAAGMAKVSTVAKADIAKVNKT